MIKNSLKKIFIKISRLLGFEIIDQNSFVSPTLNKELNENLSQLNKKSIVLKSSLNIFCSRNLFCS